MKKLIIFIAVVAFVILLVDVLYVWPKEREADEANARIEKLVREDRIMRADSSITIVGGSQDKRGKK